MNHQTHNDELICTALLEISSKLKHIASLFPKENEHILKHLAASSIHLSLFARDFHDISMGKKTNLDPESIEQFLKSCGCDIDNRRKE
jgi:hypothetical protein